VKQWIVLMRERRSGRARLAGNADGPHLILASTFRGALWLGSSSLPT